MTLGTVSATGSSEEESCFCSCCGAKMMPYFTDNAVVSQNQINQLISESFLTVKGAALFLPRGNSTAPTSTPRITQRRNKHTGDLQQHLQTMFTLLRPEDTIRLAVRLESACPQFTRYMVVVSTNGRQDTEESVVLGMDFSSDSVCTVGLVLPLWSDTLIHLDGDGGFSVSTVNRIHIFKPVSVQAMWSALQSLHKACEVARCHNYHPGSLFLTWVSYYQSRMTSDQFCINEWNAMQDVESHRSDSPLLFTDVPTERERTERLIKTRLREIMMQKDLENVTCKEIRTELEMQMVCNLREFKEFIDKEMIVILGQMDSPTEIFDHVYLGSEWNASNLEELQNSGVRYILNVTREIDNFFPGVFEYHNIRVYDEEDTNLLEYWNDTYKFITKAKKAGAKCLVHCKMGISRSASTVIAYAMKEYGWDLDTAFDYVKEKRAVTNPNPSFMKQLEEYQGILLASKQRHNKLWRSHSESDLPDRHDSLCKPASISVGRPDPRSSNNNTSSPSLHHLLGVAVLQVLGAESQDSTSDSHSELATMHTSESPTHLSQNGLCDSPDEESELGNMHREDPLLLPLPRPRAATLVPEVRTDNSEKVTITLPVASPHPPPSLHHLPVSPGLKHLATWVSSTVPEKKPVELFLDLLERSSSGEISPLTLGSSDSGYFQELSLLESARKWDSVSSDLRLVSPVSPMGPNDDNNNPSESRTNSPGSNAGGSSTHRTDSIDFFSAREKFLGLAQDGRNRTLSELAPQKTTLLLSLEDPGETATDEENPEKNILHGEDICNKPYPDKTLPHHHDSGISVRHIVTEIESISNPTTSSLAPSSSTTSTSPVPPSTRNQLLLIQEQQNRETGEVKHGSLTPPFCLQSPCTPPCDWLAGSVRRATKQLEQRMKQELEIAVTPSTQRSTVFSPSNEDISLLLYLSCSQNTETPPLDSPPQSTEPAFSFEHELTQEQSSSKPKDTEIDTESPRKLHRLDSDMDTLPDPSHALNWSVSKASGGILITVDPSTDSHSLNQAPPEPEAVIIDSSLDTSPQSQLHPTQLIQNQSEPKIHLQASAEPLTLTPTLERLIVQGSDTGQTQGSVAGDGLRSNSPSSCAQDSLTCKTQELDKIQQTLHNVGDLDMVKSMAHFDNSHGQILESRRMVAEDAGGETEEDFDQASHSTDLVQGIRKRQGKSFREPAGRQRAMDLEARIRQAGLTPPSLMKRSASLAKLDCLELSANDLNDWELRLSPSPSPRTQFSNPLNPPPLSPIHPLHPYSGPDDTWKKQRVLAQIPYSDKTGPIHHVGVPVKSSTALFFCFPSSSHYHHPQKESGEEDEEEATFANGNSMVAMTTARQQGRGLSARRSRRASAEKKQRTAAMVYNTM